MELPGNVWLIDLPGNGANVSDDFAENCDQWIEIFPEIVKRFDHPVLVGHSFGGMFPLMFPELEKYLEGFVILNAAPTLWLEEAVNYSKQFDVPDLTQEMTEFTLHPNQETFNTVLSACLPYYFPKETLERGRELLSQVSFQWQPAVWWQRKAIELNFSAKWIPNQIPTLIVGGKYDCICPFSLFEKDQRFQRSNIKKFFIEDAGHMGWVENPICLFGAFITPKEDPKPEHQPVKMFNVAVQVEKATQGEVTLEDLGVPAKVIAKIRLKAQKAKERREQARARKAAQLQENPSDTDLQLASSDLKS